MAYEHILVEIRGPVGLIKLNRPKAMNALCADLAREIAEAVDDYEKNDAIGALVVTGSEKAFCAGADIKEMQSQTIWTYTKKTSLRLIGNVFRNAGNR